MRTIFIKIVIKSANFILINNFLFRVKLHKLKYGTDPNFTDLKAPIFDDIGK